MATSLIYRSASIYELAMRLLYGRWRPLAWAIWTARFALPFIVLLPGAGKRRMPIFAIAAAIVAGHVDRVQAEDREALVRVGANISVAKKSASSASRRSKQ